MRDRIDRLHSSIHEFRNQWQAWITGMKKP